MFMCSPLQAKQPKVVQGGLTNAGRERGHPIHAMSDQNVPPPPNITAPVAHPQQPSQQFHYNQFAGAVPEVQQEVEYPLPAHMNGQGGENEQNAEIQRYLVGFADVIQEYQRHTDRTADFNFPVDNLRIDTLAKILNNVFTKIHGR